MLNKNTFIKEYLTPNNNTPPAPPETVVETPVDITNQNPSVPPASNVQTETQVPEETPAVDATVATVTEMIAAKIGIPTEAFMKDGKITTIAGEEETDNDIVNFFAQVVLPQAEYAAQQRILGSLDNRAKDLLDYINAGGDVEAFKAISETFDYHKLAIPEDIKDEDLKKIGARILAHEKNLDTDIIDIVLEQKLKAGELKKYVTDLANAGKKNQTAAERKLVEEQKALQVKQEQEIKDTLVSIYNEVKTKGTAANMDFTVPATDRDNLAKFLAEPSVEVNGRYMTPAAAFMNEFLSTPKQWLTLATLYGFYKGDPSKLIIQKAEDITLKNRLARQSQQPVAAAKTNPTTVYTKEQFLFGK